MMIVIKINSESSMYVKTLSIRWLHRMMSVQCLILFVFSIINYVDGDSFYDTPQLDDQFANFRITNPIPKAGSQAGGDIQDPVNIDSYSVVFEFKGKGNALLLFKEDATNETHNVCLVEIGAGETLRLYNIYKSNIPLVSKLGGGSTSLASDEEFRPFWIRWIDGATTIFLGKGYVPGESQFYGTANALPFSVNAMSISTSSAYNGSWHFNISPTTTTVSQTTSMTATNAEMTSTPDPSTSSVSSSSSAVTSESSTLETTSTASPSITSPSTSIANTSTSSTTQRTEPPSSTIANPSTSSAITSKSSTSQRIPTVSPFQNTSQYTATKVTEATFSTATTNTAVTSGQTAEGSTLIFDFFSQPLGIVITSLGAAILLTAGVCMVWQLFVTEETRTNNQIEVEPSEEDLEANSLE